MGLRLLERLRPLQKQNVLLQDAERQRRETQAYYDRLNKTTEVRLAENLIEAGGNHEKARVLTWVEDNS